MASVIQVNGKWRAQVRRKGYPVRTRTFIMKAHAQTWARRVELDIDAGKAGLQRTSTLTMADLLDKYERDIGAAKPFGRNKADVLRKFREYLGKVPVTSLTTDRIVKYIAVERNIRGTTAQIDLTYLSGILKVARTLWHLPAPHTEDARELLRHMGRLARGKPRERRPTTDELDRLREYFRERFLSQPMHEIMDFAVASAMRAGEIARIQWADIHEADKTVVIRDRKDPKEKAGNHQTVPLLGEAWDIVQRQPKIDARIFPYESKSWASLFPRACAALGIVDLRFHDLRHEAMSRFAESGKYSIPELMMISGHRDPKMLMRYVQLKAKDLHR